MVKTFKILRENERFTVTRPSCFSFPGEISRPHGARLLTSFKSRQYMPIIKQCQLVHLKATFNDDKLFLLAINKLCPSKVHYVLATTSEKE